MRFALFSTALALSVSACVSHETVTLDVLLVSETDCRSLSRLNLFTLKPSPSQGGACAMSQMSSAPGGGPLTLGLKSLDQAAVLVLALGYGQLSGRSDGRPSCDLCCAPPCGDGPEGGTDVDCPRCYGLATLDLTARTRQLLGLHPSADCGVPAEVLAEYGLGRAPLPPPACP
jgi:hypothetical protein